MKVLVAGANRVDAGKTTFSVGLIDRVGGIGFKPRAGNNLWFDHDDYRRAIDDGRLYGKDAKRLAAASPADVSPEEINPIHRLWRPDPGSAGGLLGQERRQFVLDRVSESYVVNAGADVPESARDALPLDDAVRVDSIRELNDVMSKRHLPAQAAIRRRIEQTDPTIVESYGAIARPMGDFEPHAVAVVEPARVRIYPGSRYVKACTVTTGGPDQGQLEENVGSVTELIDPIETLTLPPLPGEKQSDPAAIADAYEHAYDAFLRVARDAEP
jgi:predicted P-loop ATPase/GTPase